MRETASAAAAAIVECEIASLGTKKKKKKDEKAMAILQSFVESRICSKRNRSLLRLRIICQQAKLWVLNWLSDKWIGRIYSISTLFQQLCVYVCVVHYGNGERTQKKAKSISYVFEYFRTTSVKKNILRNWINKKQFTSNNFSVSKFPRNIDVFALVGGMSVCERV